jgi:hypothetical protein
VLSLQASKIIHLKKTDKMKRLFIVSVFLLALLGCSNGVNDEEPPVITLLGESEMIHFKGEAWVEPGFTAVDNEDGNITTSVTIEGEVGDVLGENYIIRYQATDMAGNFSSVSRYVTVYYRNQALSGTYDVEESTPIGVRTYAATVVESNSSDNRFIFGSVSANPPISALAEMTSPTTIELVEVYDGGTIDLYSASIQDLNGTITLTFNYRRNLGNNFFDCRAVYSKR